MIEVSLHYQRLIEKYLFTLAWCYFMFKPVFGGIAFIPIKTNTIIQMLFNSIHHIDMYILMMHKNQVLLNFITQAFIKLLRQYIKYILTIVAR